LVQLLDVVERSARLLGVERDGFAVLLNFHPAKGPEDAAPGHLGIGIIGKRGPDRIALGLAWLAPLEQVIPGARPVWHAGCAAYVASVQAHERHQEVRHALPLPVDLAERLSRGAPTAVLLAYLVDDVRQVDQVFVV